MLVCDLLGFGRFGQAARPSLQPAGAGRPQQALLGRLGVDEPLHVLAHDYGDSVARNCSPAITRPAAARLLRVPQWWAVPGNAPPVLSQKLLLSPLGGLFGRLFDRRALARNFAKVFGPRSQPGETELDAFWSLIESNQGQRVMHRLIRYIVDRREQRERWVAALQHGGVPLRVIDGAVDPISGRTWSSATGNWSPMPTACCSMASAIIRRSKRRRRCSEHYLAFRARLDDSGVFLSEFEIAASAIAQGSGLGCWRPRWTRRFVTHGGLHARSRFSRCACSRGALGCSARWCRRNRSSRQSGMVLAELGLLLALGLGYLCWQEAVAGTPSAPASRCSAACCWWWSAQLRLVAVQARPAWPAVHSVRLKRNIPLPYRAPFMAARNTVPAGGLADTRAITSYCPGSRT